MLTVCKRGYTPDPMTAPEKGALKVNIQPHTSEISTFFQINIPDQIHLTAITPDGTTTGRDFGTDVEGATSWALMENRKGRNIHFTVNRVRPGVNRKPTKTDITNARFAHADVDPMKDGTPWDKEAVVKMLESASIAPSTIINSGNGLQGLWRLRGEQNVQDVETANLSLIHSFNGDLGTQNIDRLLRVPGTVNWPNKRKKEQGRVPVMATTIEHDNGKTHLLIDIVQTFRKKGQSAQNHTEVKNHSSLDLSGYTSLSTADLNLSHFSRLPSLIDDPKGEDRSSDTYAFVCEALREGLTPEQIAGILLNPVNAIAEHCLSQPDPNRAVRRVLQRALTEEDVARRVRQRQEDKLIGETGDYTDIPTARVYSLNEMLDSKVFIADGSQVADLYRAKSVLNLTDFRNATAASVIEVVVNGQYREVKVAQQWLKSGQRKNTDTLTFRPGYELYTRDPNERSALNLWRPSSYASVPENWEERVEPFLIHIRWLFDQDANAFLDWLAHLIQKPGVLPSYGWLHIAREQGLGRNWIAGILARLWPGMVALGFDLVNALSTGFNGELGGKILAVVDEIDEGGGGKTFQHAQALKKIITEETRLINPKYGRQRLEFNMCRWLIFSNSSTALPLEDKDRRFWVSRCDDTAKKPSYYTQLYALRDDPAFIASLAHWLCQRDISNFNPGERPPMNAAKQALLSRTRSPAEQTLHDISRHWPSDLVSSEELDHLIGAERPRGRALAYALERAGLVKVGEYKPASTGITRPRITIYAIQNIEIWQSVPVDMMRSEIRKLTTAQKEEMLIAKSAY